MNSIQPRPKSIQSYIPLFALLVSLQPIVGVSPAFSQTADALIQPTTQESESTPEYEIEGSSQLSSDEAFTGEVFHYTLTLSWEGQQEWLSLDPPEIAWPEEIEQVDTRIKSVSKAGAHGPRGEKSFIYDLTVKKAGKYDLPDVDVEILFQDSSTKTVDILGKTVNVTDRPPPAGQVMTEKLKKNGWIIGGVCALIVAALFFFILSNRKKGEVETDRPDPWEPVEESLNRCEALQKAGQAREFYGALESTLIAACTLCQGSAPRKLSDCSMVKKLEGQVQEDFKSLSGEIEERKYRPDQPRPEEMERTQKQARKVLSSLKQIYQERGS
ncbi:MAG: hypothetical protein KC931_08270 [Candidatus Omnitrophica bacterium]|nr:hypothetical protein [Candidatus Omnitrophota bacterium]